MTAQQQKNPFLDRKIFKVTLFWEKDPSPPPLKSHSYVNLNLKKPKWLLPFSTLSVHFTKSLFASSERMYICMYVCMYVCMQTLKSFKRLAGAFSFESSLADDVVKLTNYGADGRIQLRLWHCKLIEPRDDQGCQIFLCTTYQNGINIPKRAQNLPNIRKMCATAVKWTKRP
jgi:hypothetical protein